MKRNPDQCPYRISLGSLPAEPAVACGLAQQVLGTARADLTRVEPAACRECCADRLPGPMHLNRVVASLIFRAATELIDDVATAGLDRMEAMRARRFVLSKLEVLPRESGNNGQLPSQHGADDAARPTGVRPSRLHWAVGLLTAPRREPTIDRTLLSLTNAGFAHIHIFAEPDSWIPEEYRHLPVTTHGRVLGNLGNFFTSLASLLMLEPHADCYALFQDDVEAADGLRDWCDAQFWPHGVGLVSLYTCGVQHAEHAGWRILRAGMHHTFGGLAFVFRRDVLKEFLSDGRLLDFRQGGFRAGDDGVVGEWATRSRVGIAYHTPSLVAHVGAVSSISETGQGISGPLTRTRAVRSVGELPSWAPPARGLGRVGLVGWNTASGLGYLNRDLACHFPLEKWLVPTHPRFPTLPPPATAFRVDGARLDLSEQEQKAWLRGLDWLVFTELPYLPRLVSRARELGIRTACVPMWECTDLETDWLHLTDLMICPTRHTYDLFSNWKRRFGFAWQLVYVPWPVDLDRFRFRRRKRCERFLFVNGTGGCRATGADGKLTQYRRKGLDIVLEAARRLRPIPFLVYSQVHERLPIPDNVELRYPPAQNERLYDEGDVCVQPSRWEGLGLQLLECQAAGLPLVTTDAPPMNELQPLRAVAARSQEIVSIVGRNLVTAHHVAPDDLAVALEPLYRSRIDEPSTRARSFIEREHSWTQALVTMIAAMSH